MDTSLKKSFRTRDVLSLAFGTMIGWGWVMLAGEWAESAGLVGAMLAFVIGAAMCVVVGLNYAELTPAIPVAGGSVAFSLRAMGHWPAVFAGLSTALAYLGVAAWEGPAFASAIDYIVALPRLGYLWTIQGFDVYASWALVAILASAILTAINILGAKQTALFQTVATAGILIIGVIFILGGAAFGSLENAGPAFTSGGGFASVLLMVPAMFVGFDVIPQSSGEMDVPLHKIPKILVLSICAAALWYILMIYATAVSAPASVRAQAAIPVADAMAYAYGNPIWGKICIVGALCGILTSWNGFLYGAARCLYAMARAKLMPAFLADLHPKYATPYKAILLCGLISTFSCLLGTGALTWFVNASSFAVILMYSMAVLSFIFLRKRFADLPRPYRIKRGKLLSLASILVIMLFAYLYLPVGPSSLSKIEWLMVLVWYFLGFAMAIAYRLYKKQNT